MSVKRVYFVIGPSPQIFSIFSAGCYGILSISLLMAGSVSVQILLLGPESKYSDHVQTFQDRLMMQCNLLLADA